MSDAVFDLLWIAEIICRCAMFLSLTVIIWVSLWNRSVSGRVRRIWMIEKD